MQFGSLSFLASQRFSLEIPTFAFLEPFLSLRVNEKNPLGRFRELSFEPTRTLVYCSSLLLVGARWTTGGVAGGAGGGAGGKGGADGGGGGEDGAPPSFPSSGSST